MGATAAELAATLPGDDLVPDATAVFDRAATLPAAPVDVWPWLLQLGLRRAGWYFPRRLERLTPPARRGLRHLDPALQHVEIGDEHPDWGPGEPVLRVVDLVPERAIVYLSLRDKSNGHRWPRDGRADRPGVLALSWVLVLSAEGADATRLHLRLRARIKARRVPLTPLFELFDAVTVALLFAGLRERVSR